MKMKYPKLLLAFALLPFSAAATEQVVRIHPLFDSGRVSTNDLATTDFAQWTNGVGSTRANNVGWNESRGIWYSFIRFSGTRTEDNQVFGLSLANWHEALTKAGSVTLRGDVNWHEINPDFPGEPGVQVSVWLVPGLDIPEGSLPGFGNTWPWNYANARKVTSFGPNDVTPLHASWDDAEFDPADTRDKMAYALQIDLTSAIQAALAAGHMTPSTPWGIVFFPEEMEDQLNIPNNPLWIDRRQTVLHGAFWEVVVVESDEPDPLPPVAPGSLVATAGGLDRIHLSWADNSDDETGFRLEVSTDGGSNFSLLATLDAGVTAYTHIGLFPSTTFHYRVRAENAAGASAWSNSAMATTDDEPEPDPDPIGWAGFPVDEDGWVDTGDFLGLIYVSGDYVFSLSLNRWTYLPESLVISSGGWGYFFR